MPTGRLSDLQQRVLISLAGTVPPWTLSGGAALAGFYTRHRETRDLGLFWQHRRSLGTIGADTRRRLEDAGFEVATIQNAEAFCKLRVKDGANVITVDLVADPVPLSEEPHEVICEGVTFLIDSPHQLLVNKLCAVLGRSEPRDIEDIQALVDAGGQIARALDDCPQQDAGFSPLTLAWAAQGLPLRRLAESLGWTTQRIDSVCRFKDDFVTLLLARTKPLE